MSFSEAFLHEVGRCLDAVEADERRPFVLPADVFHRLGPELARYAFFTEPGDHPQVVSPQFIRYVGHGNLAAGIRKLEQFCNDIRQVRHRADD